jgi:uncharacterized protein (DUF3820 family)
MGKSTYKLTFGKHKGKTLDYVPFDYLRWLARQSFAPNAVKEYVKRHKDFI